MRGLPNDSIAQKGNISLWSLQTVSSGCCQCKQYPYLTSFQVTWLTGENRNREEKRVSLHRGGKCHGKARGQSRLGSQLWLGLLGATQLLLGQQVASCILSGLLGLDTKATSSGKPHHSAPGEWRTSVRPGSPFSLCDVVWIQSCSLSQSDHIWNFSEETPRELTRTRGLHGSIVFLSHPARAPRGTPGDSEYERISV